MKIVIALLLSFGLVSCGGDSGSSSNNIPTTSTNDQYPDLNAISTISVAANQRDTGTTIFIGDDLAGETYTFYPHLLGNGKIAWITCKDKSKYLYIKSASNPLVTVDNQIKTPCSATKVGYEVLKDRIHALSAVDSTSKEKIRTCRNNGNIIHKPYIDVANAYVTYRCHKVIFIKESRIKSISKLNGDSWYSTNKGQGTFKGTTVWINK